MKLIGIDYGTKRIGVAISDETQTLAREYAIWKPQEFWQQLTTLLEREPVERIVIGLPLNMSGHQTDKSREVQEFADQLQQRVTVPIEFMDERLSSVMAHTVSGSRDPIDSLAAQIILQNYLDKQKQ